MKKIKVYTLAIVSLLVSGHVLAINTTPFEGGGWTITCQQSNGDGTHKTLWVAHTTNGVHSLELQNSCRAGQNNRALVQVH